MAWLNSDIVLVNPFFPEGGNDGWTDSGEHLFDPDQICEHVGLGYLAASLRSQGIRVSVIDADVERIANDELIRRITDLSPRFVGITVCHETYSVAHELCELVSRLAPDMKVIVGGPLLRAAGGRASSLFPSAHHLVLGEGEQSLQQLLDDTSTHSRELRAPPSEDLDSIPFPVRDVLPLVLERQVNLGLPTSVRLVSSRGCPGTCNFCTIADYAKTNPDEIFWRPRSAENVVAEMAYLQQEFAPDCQFFSDDIFLCGHRGRERALAIANLLRQRGLKVNFTFSCRVNDVRKDVLGPLSEAGLYHVSFGVETIDTGSLRLLNKFTQLESFLRAFKILDELDVSVSVYMMLYHPFTSLAEIAANYEFLKSIGAFNTIASERTVFSLLYQCKTVVRRFGDFEHLLRTKGLLRKTRSNEAFPLIADYDFADPDVAEFVRRLWSARGANPNNLISGFEDTLTSMGHVTG